MSRTVVNPIDLPAQSPPRQQDGEPIPCPRCGGIFEAPVKGLMGHPMGHPTLCPPIKGQSILSRDARVRKQWRPGR